MSRRAFVSVAVAACLVVFELAGSQTAIAQRWRRPLPGGAVVGAFTYERAAPYQRGRRRGIDIAAAAGTPVLAVCSGNVAYAGRVPGRPGAGVTIRCGRLVATELGLSRTLVRRGVRVGTGMPIGLLGPRPLRLGARVATDRHGYLDPLVLIHDGGGAPIAPPPVVPRRRRAKPRPGTPQAMPVAAPHAAALPWPAVAGLAVLTSCAAGTATLRVRRRRHAHRATAAAHRR